MEMDLIHCQRRPILVSNRLEWALHWTFCGFYLLRSLVRKKHGFRHGRTLCFLKNPGTAELDRTLQQGCCPRYVCSQQTYASTVLRSSKKVSTAESRLLGVFCEWRTERVVPQRRHPQNERLWSMDSDAQSRLRSMLVHFISTFQMKLMKVTSVQYSEPPTGQALALDRDLSKRSALSS